MSAIAEAPSKKEKKSAKVEQPIILPKLNIQTFDVTLVGDSSLISHAWSKKAKTEMLAKHMKKAKQGKQAKDPFQDFCESLYWLTPMPESEYDKEGNRTSGPTDEDVKAARFGFPTVAFKSAAVDACSHIEGVTKVEARGAFHINGEMIEIHGTPVMREDMVRVGMGAADIRFRGEFKEWHVSFQVRYNANVLSKEQICNLFNTAGFAIGVGEWRPQRDGSYGMFHVEQEK